MAKAEVHDRPPIGLKLVHLDLKGAPPRIVYLAQLFPLFSRLGANALLLEYEDMFPYEGSLEILRAKHAYSPSEIRELLDLAQSNGLEVIPLVQTFGHMEFVLKHKQFSHLREVKWSPNALNPHRPESLQLIHTMTEQVLGLHPGARWLHIGADEFVLKHKQFSHLREVKWSPNALNPHRPESLQLIHTMTEQVLGLHPGARWLHIGADEVYFLGEGEESQRWLSSSDRLLDSLFVSHVVKVAEQLRSFHPAVKPVMWDDMLRSMSADFLSESGIGQLVEPMVWDYLPNLDVEKTERRTVCVCQSAACSSDVSIHQSRKLYSQVYFLGEGEESQQWLSSSDRLLDSLFVSHVVKVAEQLRSFHPAVKPVMWDDMLRSMSADFLSESGIGQLVEPMVWDYLPNLDVEKTVLLIDKYQKGGLTKLWIASSFKGSTEVNQCLTCIRNHLDNHTQWLQVVKALTRGDVQLQGIALTGWQRYDHFSVLCELLPVAIPSLAACLQTLQHGSFTEEAEQTLKQSLGISAVEVDTFIRVIISNPVPSCPVKHVPVPSHPMKESSFPILSHPVLSNMYPSRPIPSHERDIISNPVKHVPVPSHPMKESSFPILSHPVLSNMYPFHPIPSHERDIISNHVPSCPVKHVPVPSHPMKESSFPILSHPVLSNMYPFHPIP
ncbi:UNVERIFIED_CONTAM: hypothetical protein FKN15_055419 [Acipenser sinensis]